MTSTSMSPADRSELAGEYAIGLLDGEELRRTRALVETDIEFATEVGRWRGYFAQLFDTVEPVRPPARVLEEIQQRIDKPQQQSDNVYKLHRRLNAWRGFAVGTSAIAASLALVLLTRPDAIEPVPVTREPAEPMVATVAGEDTDARLIATWDPGERSLVVAAAAGVEDIPGRSHELWVIPADGTPRSMGVMPGAEPMHLRVAGPMADQLVEGATLAVSVEPAGGSPTGQPTGPVIAAGALQRI